MFLTFMQKIILTHLQIFIDQSLVVQKAKPDTRKKPVQNRAHCDFGVGMSENSGISMQFDLQILHIIYAEKDIVTSLGKVTGKLDTLFLIFDT